MNFKISDAANTYNIAIHILSESNFTVQLDDQDEDCLFVAKNGLKIYKAEDPLSLLAISLLSDQQVDEFHETEYIDNNILSAINTLLSKKFSLSVSNTYSDKWFDWIAVKNDNEFIGKTPLRIFALTIIFDHYGETWRDQSIPHYYTDLFKK